MNVHKKNHLQKTIKALSYNVLGVILPFILSLIPILILKKYDKIEAFLDEGEFLIFAAGLYTGALFLFGENSNSIKKGYDKFLSATCLWLLIICSSSYAIIYCLQILDVFKNIDLSFIRIYSIIIFSIAVLASYRSVFIDFLKIYPQIDVEQISKQDVDNIVNNI
ncbi:hypothetical protein ABIB62_001086 [Mucilaginibacter sp. UYP25]|uniref:hypothetical protein n=1 Tax=unclassified Mucilaginibacter TaxID=2617802 RepID=UPI0033998ABC